jgi:DNA-binding CsgD family transcriptional regulator
MTTVTSQDYHEILDTIYAVSCCEDKESFLDTLMPSMMRLFRAECATFHIIQGYPWHIKIVESRSFKSDRNNLNEDKIYPQLYTDNFYQHSPLLKQALSSSDSIFKIGESISPADWEHSNLYNQFIVPQNLYWELFLSLRWKNNFNGMLTLWRSKNQGDYQDLDISKAEILVPFLPVAMHTVDVNTVRHKGQQQLIFTDEGDSRGILILNHKLRPVYFDGRARHICLSIGHESNPVADPHAGDEFPVPECIMQDCSVLLELLKRDESPVLWPRERIISLENGLKYHLESSLVWQAGQTHSVPNFVIVLNDAREEVESGLRLQTKFNLSRRELDIIYHVARGLSYNEIADTLYISRQTVHTHVKNIYRKLGTKSRIELYRYVQPLSWTPE